MNANALVIDMIIYIYSIYKSQSFDLIYSLTSGQSATVILPCRRAHIHTCKLSIATYTQIHTQLTIII